MRAIEDLILWRSAATVRDLRRRHPSIVLHAEQADPALLERVSDALRPAAIAEARQRAASGAASERARLRLIAGAYLATAAPELDEEWASLRSRLLAPWRGEVDAALAAEDDPAVRGAIASRFSEAIDRLAPLEAERGGARDEAARRAGAADAATLARAGRDPEAEVFREEIEKGFIAPLDEYVAVAAQDRWRRAGIAPASARDEDVPRLSWFPVRRELLPPAALMSFVRRLGAGLGLDPDARGVQIVAVERPAAATLLEESIAPRPVLVPGTWGGARGLLDAFEATGRGIRIAFLREVRGASAAALADPAYAEASGALFRQLAASIDGARSAGLPGDETLIDDLRLERTIEARSAWASLASEGRATSDGRRLFARAAGRPPAPGAAEAAAHDGRDADARLRGEALAVLLGERLMTRFGRAWFTLREAGAFLKDFWTAEPDESPRAMAAALGLGTMDSSPLLEAHRPRKGRVA